MAPPIVDMNSSKAWDDSVLTKSWDNTKAEYMKYHSIHMAGKKLEEVLSAEELAELRDDYGSVVGEKEPGSLEAGTDGLAEEKDADTSKPEANPITVEDNAEMSQDMDVEEEDNQLYGQEQDEEDPEQHEQQDNPATEGATPQIGGLDASIPGPLLETLPDDHVRNIAMAWYYAGYYAGLYAAQKKT